MVAVTRAGLEHDATMVGSLDLAETCCTAYIDLQVLLWIKEGGNTHHAGCSARLSEDALVDPEHDSLPQRLQ